MTIRPPQPGQASRTPLSRANTSSAPAPAPRAAEGAPPAGSAPAPRQDAVQISAQARSLQAAGHAAHEDAGALEPERLQQILQRMSDGHYDRPEVQDAVLKRIAAEL
ncbi:MAG: flagellar biosynthesis anti-sigma factor FlgM [Candidatus Eisenbacteria bacterium]|uniref:Flagellar biosynthesis anti-sigma factor FlgM n=1 Tax=Eiseniibacteriota bacterium TaxID=2212470 RepID=A0A933W4F4_UNCEI|nr:flagellar biosynthesis anti-sigma factor FlgM [Candidatus Eisenbacteria bacterium]